MKQSISLLSLLALSSLSCFAAVSGTVTDRVGKGLAGVGVSLAFGGGSTTTDTTGAWSLATTEIDARIIPSSRTRWTGKSVELNLSEPATVLVEAYDLKGAIQGRVARVKLGAGSYSLPLALSGSGMVWLRVTVNGRPETILAGAVVGIGHARSLQSARSLQRQQPTTAARTQGLVDTLRFTWKSRLVAQVPLAIQDTAGVVVRMDTSSVYAWNDSIAYGILYDARDGQVYRTVKIGSQTWMAENLNFKAAGADSGWCYNNSRDSCTRYGRLYTWLAVMANAASSTQSPSGVQGICPAGWHVPSENEWTTLVTTVEAISWVNLCRGGKALKSNDGWWFSGDGTDQFGFRALPGGILNGSYFTDVGAGGNWWSVTEYDVSHAWGRFMDDYDAYVNRFYFDKSLGFSLRCSQD